MNLKNKHITVFEHQSIKLNQKIDGVEFNSSMLKAMQLYYGEKGVPYFSLIHNGVRFNEHVGIIQIGETMIEVLPKADNSQKNANEKKKWRDILIDMLFAINVFEIHAPSSSSLKVKHNSILDLYFEIFIKEVEYLLHNGLIKQYRKKEGNVSALKGNILFGKHIQQNIVHQERFYVCYTTYDVEHTLHFILFKTIKLLKQINTNNQLHSRIGALLLHFPEMPDVKISEATFEKISLNRKTQSYKNAIEVSKLLLLRYHPDIQKGKNNVLALMFDMNKLWEQFVLVSLRKHKPAHTTITAQTSKNFWKPETGYHSRIKPDIVINKNTDNCIILDTKWKNLNGYKPSPDDLRQMYVYHEYFSAKRVALIYPSDSASKSSGKFLDPQTSKELDKECSVLSLAVKTPIKFWQRNIYEEFDEWLGIEKWSD